MLTVTGATVRFDEVTALDHVSFDLPNGEVLVVLGPSGSGKSTLLRAIAGLQPLDEGTVAWDGQTVDHVAPHLRQFGLMFQDYALFPHRDVAGNVGFGLEMMDHPDADTRTAAVLDMVGLSGFESRPVGSLSGGEQQRVALARALAPEPRMLMLDEPLGALDRTLREQLLGDLRELFGSLGMTTLYVTHDQEEAFGIADTILVIHRGKVMQHGSPQELWASPASEFVASFLGFDLLAVRIASGVAASDAGTFTAPTEDGLFTAVLRPHALHVEPDGGITGKVERTWFQAGERWLEVALATGLRVEVASNDRGVGDELTLDVEPSRVSYLRAATGPPLPGHTTRLPTPP